MRIGAGAGMEHMGEGEELGRSGRRPLVVAHRGGAGLAPENTLAAFRRALDIHVDALELDVRLSRDGHPVVIHDATVDRTTEGSGRVSELPLVTLQALRPRGGPAPPGASLFSVAAGVGVPALPEVLALVRGRTRLFIDLKTDDGEPHRAIEKKVVGTIQPAGAEAAVTFLSADLLCLRRLRELRGTIPLGLLASWRFFRAHGRAALDRLLEEARGLRAERACIYHELLTPDLLEAVRDAGLAVDVWTVNDAAAMRRFALQGVDAIFTDRPDLLQQVLSELPADAPGA